MRNKLTRCSLAVAILGFVFVVGARGQTAPELATFQGKGYRLNWLALSADGSRVAAAAVSSTIGLDGRNNRIPGEVTIWDVQGGNQVSGFKVPGATFARVEFSANGTSLLTTGLDGRGISSFQVWDVATGRAIDTLGPPPPAGYYTTVALSPDGRYLAAVFNTPVANQMAANQRSVRDLDRGPLPKTRAERLERARSKSPNRDERVFGPLHAWRVSEVTVLDTTSHRVKWRLPGVAHQADPAASRGSYHNEVTWKDSLAFSPDGKRLALFSWGSRGPTSERAGVQPNLPQGTYKSLKMLSLDDGQRVPRVVYESTVQAEGPIMWPTGGRSLLVSNDRAIVLLDPASGQGQGSAYLPFPQPLAAIRIPGHQPRPPGLVPRGGSDLPSGWFEDHVTLSADGSKAAAYFHCGPFSPNQQRDLGDYVVLWDVASRRVLRWLHLPDGPFASNGNTSKPAGSDRAGVHPRRIALSGDDKKLAVSDSVGAVRIYDVSGGAGGVGVALARPGNAPGSAPGSAPANSRPLTAADVASVRLAYENATAHARAVLLASLIQSIQVAGQNAVARPSNAPPYVARLKAEKEAFERHGLIPFSGSMRGPTTQYLKALADERAKVVTSFGSTPIPDDLRKLIDHRVLARWNHQAAGQNSPGINTLYSSGRIDDPQSDDLWSYAGGRLILKWKARQAPGGYWVDTCIVAPDGLTYAGTNQNNVKITGRLVSSD
jgi:hypothetical protein